MHKGGDSASLNYTQESDVNCIESHTIKDKGTSLTSILVPLVYFTKCIYQR